MAGTKRDSLIGRVLLCALGTTAWINTCGVAIELPLMVGVLPESWKLPSYIILVNQFANVSAVLFLLLSRYTKKRIEIPANYTILSIGIVSLVLMSFFWDKTVAFGGGRYSVALLTLTFCLSMVDCTSSVSYLAFLSFYPESFLAFYFIGEGLSAVLPSVVALIQGVGGNSACFNASQVNGTQNETDPFAQEIGQYFESEQESPLFPVETYFLLLASVMACGLVAFILLNTVPRLLALQIVPNDGDTRKLINDDLYENSRVEDHEYGTVSKKNDGEKSEVSGVETAAALDEARPNGAINVAVKSDSGRADFIYWCALQLWCSAFLYGIMYSVVIYAALPYGVLVFHLSLTLPQMSNPLMCIVAHYLPTLRKSVINSMALVGSGGAAYIIWLGANSQKPILCGSIWGGIIEVGVFIIVICQFTYIRVMAAQFSHQLGRQSLIVNSFMSQCGGILGTAIIFPLINYTHIFVPSDPCTHTCY
ncbi:solute carrier family 52, riboflavin transporter, member 3-B-like [Ptychodera flava]|uniref:solute carrier family 52, riboflavin transporter, member 3-B-like n=1 Tax=Ptychodera flava TaxID=63121 RepID=UPI00396A92E9